MLRASSVVVGALLAALCPTRAVEPPPVGRAPAPATSAAFSSLMARASAENATLLRYLYPSVSQLTKDVHRNWVPATEGCEMKFDCWCYHVRGDMSSSLNPDGWQKCAHLAKVESSCVRSDNTCRCFSGQRCLFSDMRPTKILAVITAARLAGVDHIIEEGRFGGLSAYMYWLHGLRVTSVEFLPLDGPTNALREMAPGVRLLEGDGAVLVPQLVAALTPAERARTMVIFDGEKRLGAYGTYVKIQDKVALAVFDDTNISDGPRFKATLAQNGHVFFDTLDRDYAPFLHREAAALSLLRPLKMPQAEAVRERARPLGAGHARRRRRLRGHAAGRHGDTLPRASAAAEPRTTRNATRAAASRALLAGGRVKWFGGIDHLDRYHFTIVKGEAWAGPPAGTAPARPAPPLSGARARPRTVPTRPRRSPAAPSDAQARLAADARARYNAVQQRLRAAAAQRNAQRLRAAAGAQRNAQPSLQQPTGEPPMTVLADLP